MNIYSSIETSLTSTKLRDKGKGIDKVALVMAILLIPVYILGLWLEFNPIKECKIYVDGKVIAAETRKFTVKELLAQENISLGTLDKVEPKLDFQLQNQQEIKVDRVNIRRVEKEKEVPYRILTKKDNNLLYGVKKVIVTGKKGIKVEIYEVLSVNGVEKERELVKSKEIDPPKNQLVAYGTKKKIVEENNIKPNSKMSRSVPSLSRGGKLGRVLYLESTAYTHTGNRTATGIWPHKGIVAVDPRVIPLGTKLYVEGYGYAIAADTGGAIRGGIIDVFFNSLSECIHWGRRKVKVQLIN